MVNIERGRRILTLEPEILSNHKYQPIGTGMQITVNELGEFIREARLAIGLSQKQLANEVGLSQSTITHLETGLKTNLRNSNLIKLAKALDVDIKILLELTRGIYNPKSELGKLILGIMRVKGLDTKDLYRALKISSWHATKILNGTKSSISYPKIGLLADFLGLDKSTLIKFSNITGRKRSNRLGIFIQKRRQFLGIPAVKLSKILGKSRSYVGAIELGRVRLTNKNIPKIAEILQIDPQELKNVRDDR